MNNHINLIITVVLISLMGCKGKLADSIEEVDTNDFPLHVELKEFHKISPSISSIGISEIKVVDSMLIVSTLSDEDFWHVYSSPKMDMKGRLFNVGNGHFEFPIPIPCFQSSFYKDADNNINVDIPILERQKMINADLSGLLQDKDYRNNIKILDLKTESMPLWISGLDKNRYLEAIVNPEAKKIERSIKYYNDHDVQQNSNIYLDMLNMKKVDTIEDIQLLLTSPSIGVKRNMVAEIPGYSNIIIGYSTTGNEGFCLKYKNMSYDETQLRHLAKNYISLFGGGYGHDDYFAFIRNDIENDRVVNQHLDFISWSGKPLGTINTGMNSIRRFDIDEINGIIYCLDGATDSISVYNAQPFIRELKKIGVN